MHTFKKLVQSSAATARQLRAVRHLRWIAAAALGPIGLVAALMTISSAGATGASISVTVLPVADTYVDAGHAKSSYGTASSLWVKGSPVNRTYLRFDLPTVRRRFRRPPWRCSPGKTARPVSRCAASRAG